VPIPSGPHQTLDYLFSPHFISENAEFDDVLAVLVAVAAQDDSVAERLASDYQATLDWILGILGDSSPTPPLRSTK